MTLSCSSVVAMILGVSCPLATCSATSIEPKMKTTKNIVRETIVSMTSVAEAAEAAGSGIQ